MSPQLKYPVNSKKTDANQTRITAFWVLLFTTFYLLFDVLTWLVILVFDFGLRSLALIKFSPLSFISKLIINGLNLDGKLIDNISKVFAARIGFYLCSLICFFSYLGYIKAAATLAFVLFFIAFVESAFGICIGCHIYIRYKKIVRECLH
jgi:hypothetical protein